MKRRAMDALPRSLWPVRIVDTGIGSTVQPDTPEGGDHSESYGRPYHEVLWALSGHHRPVDGSARGNNLWVPGGQWRGQNHHHAHDFGYPAPRSRLDYLERPGCAPGAAPALGLSAGGARTLSQNARG